MKLSYFNLARKASQKSPSKVKMGCVIVKRKFVCPGWNYMEKSHPKSNSYDNYLHAEIHALIRFNNRSSVEGADVYVYRETKTGELANSKPCSICMMALRESRVKRVCFIEDGKFTWEYVV